MSAGTLSKMMRQESVDTSASEPIQSRQRSIPSSLSGVPDWQWLRELRHVPAARLHGRRRRAARVLLGKLTPRSVLFVCHGNICRSPFAAAAFVRYCSPEISGSMTVASAGFIGPERPAASQALAMASRFGVDIAGHRSALVTSQSLESADLIVVMSEEQARDIRPRVSPATAILVLGDLDPQPIHRRTILDPWGGPDAAFQASYQRIDRCVRELAQIVAKAY